MKDACYLVFDAYGISKMAKRRPNLRAGEHAVLVRLTVPDALLNPPIPIKELAIGDQQMIRPELEVAPASQPEG